MKPKKEAEEGKAPGVDASTASETTVAASAPVDESAPTTEVVQVEVTEEVPAADPLLGIEVPR